LPNIELAAEIAVRSSVYAVKIPLTVSVADDRLHAVGQFSINQSDLGIEPFSAMMGAIRVRDQLDISFDIVASINP